jgi:hypothetical protein
MEQARRKANRGNHTIFCVVPHGLLSTLSFLVPSSKPDRLRDGKNAWGHSVRIEPLRPNDVLHPCRITYYLKASSVKGPGRGISRRFKRILGKGCGLVIDVRSSKTRLLADAQFRLTPSR